MCHPNATQHDGGAHTYKKESATEGEVAEKPGLGL